MMRRRQQQQQAEQEEQAEKEQDRDEDEEDDEEDRFRPFGDDAGNAWVPVQQGWSTYWWGEYEAALAKLGEAIEDDPVAFKPEVQSTIKNLTIVEQTLGRMKAILDDPANQTWIAKDPKIRTNYFLLRQRYDTLAAGIYVDARVVETADLSGTRGRCLPVETPDLGAVQRAPIVRWHGTRFAVIGYCAPLLKPMPSKWGPASPWPPDEWFDPKVGCDCDDLVGAGPALPLVPILVVAGIALLSVAAVAWAVTCLPYTVNLLEETKLQARELELRAEASREGRTLPASTLPGDKKDDGGFGAAAAILVGIVATLGVGGIVWKMSR